MPARSFVIALLVLLFSSIPGISQTIATKDTTAVSLVNAATAALAGGTPVSEIALTATVTRTVGPDSETGTATLKALGSGEGRMDLMLTSGQRSEVFNQTLGAPKGAWSGSDGVWHAEALHNCWTPTSWFFPTLALGAALSDPSIAVAYAGPTTLNGEAVQHIQFWRTVPAQNATPAAVALIKRLSTVDVYLDASTRLPVALDFTTHPDNNANLDFATEIRFGNYQTVDGVRTPTHIQKLVNNTLLLDLYVTGATANANLSPSDFTVAVQ